jgi:hypothetical protein
MSKIQQWTGINRHSYPKREEQKRKKTKDTGITSPRAKGIAQAG